MNDFAANRSLALLAANRCTLRAAPPATNFGVLLTTDHTTFTAAAELFANFDHGAAMFALCPSSDNLRPLMHFEKGGSGSSWARG
ncbi:hypothetical protein XH86_36890 (plasmid) [Bradyrhizobium guangdongense]|uniref:Uncharacterized protein n=1 Tax=Bradyrhizobium guangdongense TaxID=1325090 RepID=A0A7S7VDE5_9BRAD|nr:hypothetical protein XH86_36890 [Bradyrhizobium guangdongense]